MTGEIMSISRLRMGTDGGGVSTLVAFFGCPLHCRYCINDHCHGKMGIFFDTPRASYTPEELIGVLEKDEIYYLMTKGGVVFGGGEPLLQSGFIHEVCELADPRWSRRIETSLNVPWKYIEPVLDDFDEWIIDIKDMNPAIYREYTGRSNRYVISNLRRLGQRMSHGSLHVRFPVIPGYNGRNDIEASLGWIQHEIKAVPEVFEYQVVRNAGKMKDSSRHENK